jgi:hypothetical protein
MRRAHDILRTSFEIRMLTTGNRCQPRVFPALPLVAFGIFVTFHNALSVARIAVFATLHQDVPEFAAVDTT